MGSVCPMSVCLFICSSLSLSLRLSASENVLHFCSSPQLLGWLNYSCTKHVKVKEIQVSQNKGHICIQGDITRILWKLVCNLNTNFRISYFARMAETCMEAFSGRVVLMSNHYINVCSGSTFLGWHFTQKTIDQTLW